MTDPGKTNKQGNVAVIAIIQTTILAISLIQVTHEWNDPEPNFNW